MSSSVTRKLDDRVSLGLMVDVNSDLPTVETPRLVPWEVKRKLLIDVTDVIFYFSHHERPSGIQRVVLELVGVIFDNEDLHKHADFVAYSDTESQFIILDRYKLLLLLNHVRKQGVDGDLKERFGRMFAQGDWSELDGQPISWTDFSQANFMILGAGWVRDNFSALAEAKEQADVSVTVLIYDLIPFRYSEFFDRGTVDQFSQYLNSVVKLADRIYAISKHAARDMEQFIIESGGTPQTVHPIKLGTFEGKSNKTSDDDVLSELSPFVLYVSTIEVRKNHIMLVRIWRDLINEGIDVPNLVFVGRLGWNIENLLRLLDQTDYLDGRVTILEGLTDAQLSQLYRQSKFVVYPSFCEGWGLPVTEAICEGAPVLASNATSIPEAGGGAAKYLDPNDAKAWEAAIKEWIRSSDPRKDIDFSQFEIPQWEVAFKELIRERDDSVSPVKYRPIVKPGVEYLFAALPNSKEQRDAVVHDSITYTDPKRIPAEAFDIAFGRRGSSWHVRESFGTWLNPGSPARLSVDTKQSAETSGDFALCLNLRCVPEFVGQSFKIKLNEQEWKTTYIPSNQFILMLDDFDETGPVDLSIAVSGFARLQGQIKANYGRSVGIGISSLMLADKRDPVFFAQASVHMSTRGGRIVRI